MPIRNYEKVTKEKLAKEKKRYKKITPVWEKADLTQVELFISNYQKALYETVTELDMNKENIEFALWLYQFEFVEIFWCYENYKSSFLRKEFYGKKRAANSMAFLINEGYVEIVYSSPNKYKKVKYINGKFAISKMTSGDRFRISKLGIRNVIEVFYKKLTGKTPAKMDLSERRMIWDKSELSDFSDYTVFENDYHTNE